MYLFHSECHGVYQCHVCREVWLDAQDRIIYSGPMQKTSFQERLDENKIQTIVPNTTAKMVKAPASFRTDMPKPVMKFKQFLSKAMQQTGPIGEMDMEDWSALLCECWPQ